MPAGCEIFQESRWHHFLHVLLRRDLLKLVWSVHLSYDVVCVSMVGQDGGSGMVMGGHGKSTGGHGWSWAVTERLLGPVA